YAGQAGKRVPVPIFQALEDSVVYVVALWVERRIARRGRPIGIVATTAVTLYGAARFNDEYVLLPHSTGGDKAVLIASLAFVGVGAAVACWLLWRDRCLAHSGVTDPWRAPATAGASATCAENKAAVADPEAADHADEGERAGLVSSVDPTDREPVEAPREPRTVIRHA